MNLLFICFFFVQWPQRPGDTTVPGWNPPLSRGEPIRGREVGRWSQKWPIGRRGWEAALFWRRERELRWRAKEQEIRYIKGLIERHMDVWGFLPPDYANIFYPELYGLIVWTFFYFFNHITTLMSSSFRVSKRQWQWRRLPQTKNQSKTGLWFRFRQWCWK